MMRKAYGLGLALLWPVLWTDSTWASTDLNVQAESGWIRTKAAAAGELDRSGSTLGLAGGLRHPFSSDNVLVGSLGFRSFDITGESARRQQSLQTFAAMMRVEYRWILGNWEPGFLVNLDHGPGATLRYMDQDEVRTALSIGPEIAWRWQWESQKLIAFMATTLDVSVPKQDNIMVLAGLQYVFPAPTIEAKSVPAETPAPVVEEALKAPSPPEPEPSQEPPAPVITSLRFKPDVFQFERGSSQLTESSQRKARALSEALKPFLGTWSRIDVEGHTDAKGDAERNLKLSQDRAQSIKDFLVTQGFSAESLSAQGFGAQRPLPQLPPEDPAQRRVELRFHDLKDPETLAQALSDFVVVERGTNP